MGISLFPVPSEPVVSGPSGPSRGCRHRRGLHRQQAEDASLAIAALNWCSSSAQGPCSVEPGVHKEIAEHVARRVADRGPPNLHQSEDEAARELLQSKVGYDLGGNVVVPFEEGRVSLPQSNAGSPMLGKVLPEADKILLKRFKAEMLRGASDMMEIADPM